MEDNILMSDRSVISAHASHVGLLPEWFINLAEPNIIPDLAVYFDVPPEVGFERISSRTDLLKEECLESLSIFYENYQKIDLMALGQRFLEALLLK